MRAAAWLVGSALAAAAASAGAQTCLATSAGVNFGSLANAALANIDATTSITVRCDRQTTSATAIRVCLEAPAGSAGLTVADRRIASGANTARYQLYRNAARTQAWGLLDEAIAVDVPIAGAGFGNEATVTAYGRVFSGQVLAAGTYTSSLAVVRRIGTDTSLACSQIAAAGGTPTTLQVSGATGGACTVTASDLAFPTVARLDAAVDATGTVAVVCPLLTAYAITLNGGTTTGDILDRRMALDGDPTTTIRYQIYQGPLRLLVWGNGLLNLGVSVPGVGTGSVQQWTMYGRVPAQATPRGGRYHDTVTVTVTY